jgi:CHRD domain
MKKRTHFLIAGMLAALALAAVVAGGALAAKTVSTTAKLKASEVVPGPGEKGGSGTANVDIKKNKRKVCFEIEFKKIGEPDSATLHKGAKGEKGPKKVVLFTEPTASPAEGCVKKVKKSILNKAQNHPENFYVQLHNMQFPQGALRGQLKLDETGP